MIEITSDFNPVSIYFYLQMNNYIKTYLPDACRPAHSMIQSTTVSSIFLKFISVKWNSLDFFSVNCCSADSFRENGVLLCLLQWDWVTVVSKALNLEPPPVVREICLHSLFDPGSPAFGAFKQTETLNVSHKSNSLSAFSSSFSPASFPHHLSQFGVNVAGGERGFSGVLLPVGLTASCQPWVAHLSSRATSAF